MPGFPEKILIATDGGNDSELAIRRAVDLSNEADAELHVVHVMVLSPWMMPDNLSDTQYRRLREQAQEVLDRQVEKVREAGGSEVQGHLRTGRRAYEEVIKLAEDLETDMIAVGSRGAGTISRVIMGSDAENIVRHAAVPVLVVRNERKG